MPIPLDPRRKPASVKVHVSTGAGVDITWSDGHASHYDFGYLRDQCPCAMCGDERQKKKDLARPAGPAVLPLYKPKPKAQAASPVGNYAIQISYSDGHSSGIYSFDYLRTICPCAACGLEFRAEK